MSRIYLDNSATTAIDPEVIAAMTEIMAEHYGNPSSIHADGRKARSVIEAARKSVANHLNCSIGEIFFTSGGSEANNMVLKNSVRDLGVKHIISSPIEHHCVLHSLDAIAAADDVKVHMVRIDEKGSVDLEDLANLLELTAGDKTLVSLMHANNEVGTMINLEQVSQLCQEAGALFHTDTVQTVGYYPIDLDALKINFLSGSAHKFHGPKGVGFVYINGNNIIKPYIDGGAQERNMRGGTENIYGIVGMAKALDLAYENITARKNHIVALKQELVSLIKTHIPTATFNGDVEGGHYKVLSVSFPESLKGEMLLMNMDIAGISASGGSACSSGIDVGSHVIAHLQGDQKSHTIRLSLSHHNTMDELAYVVDKLKGMI